MVSASGESPLFGDLSPRNGLPHFERGVMRLSDGSKCYCIQHTFVFFISIILAAVVSFASSISIIISRTSFHVICLPDRDELISYPSCLCSVVFVFPKSELLELG